MRALERISHTRVQMQTFRTIIHICFEVGTALFYAASITIVLFAVTFVTTQRLLFGLAMAVAGFAGITSLWSRRIWRKYHRVLSVARSPLLAH
jgi:Cu/Ag efflux pump CusA